MEQDRRLKLIDLAIQKLINDNKLQHKDPDAEYQLALSHLLSVSQLEMSKSDEMLKQSEASTLSEPEASVPERTVSKNKDAGEVEGRSRGSEIDEIVKELKKVKKQNFVTHCLLSVMIVLTAAWQLSQVSMMLKVRDGLNHPFRSFGSMIKRMVVPEINGQEPDDKEHPAEQSPSSINMPEMPSINVPSLQN
uniref:Uncharacterized protein n=1 Tax=Lotus japonicus TaxID=34305 RepID=I3S878_LOTJA|nr:unknown [Lotus japonicus]